MFQKSPRANCYDEDEMEYWVDYRTEGSRGSEQRDVVRESMSANTNGFVQQALDLEAPSGSQQAAPGLKEEEGLKAGIYTYH